MRYKSNVWQSLTLVLQFGINMIVPIMMCTAAGVYLGNRFNAKILVIPLFIIGAIAGFRNCFIMAKRIYSKKEVKDNRDGENVKKIK